MEKAEIKTMLSELSKNYPNMQLSDTSTAWWTEALRPFDAPKVYEVIKHWVFNEKWPPTIAEIRERCLPPLPRELTVDGLAAMAQRRSNALSAEVWADMERAYGPYGQWLEVDNQWRAKEFAKRYEERRDHLRENYRKTGLVALPGGADAPPSRLDAAQILKRIGVK